MCAHTPTLLALLPTPCCSQAYRLNPKVGGSFMQEALDEMVLLLTKPEYKGKMVVILAGYEAEVGSGWWGWGLEDGVHSVWFCV